MKKMALLLSCFIFLSFISFGLMLSVKADTYTIGVESGDSQTWKITALHPSYLSYANYLEVGDLITATVQTVQNDEPSVGVVTVSVRMKYGASAEGNDDNLTIVMDPTNCLFLNYLCPVAVSTFLAARADALGDSYLAEDESTTSNSVGVITQLTFDSETGWLTKKKIFSGTAVYYQIEATTSIPGYDLYVLQGAIVVSTLGLIYIVKKKVKRI